MLVSEFKCLSCVCTDVGTTVAVQWNTNVYCINHICSVIPVTYLYSANCHMVDCSDFICGTYLCIYLSYKSIKYLAYMSNLVGIYVSYWQFCVLPHISKNVASIYPFNMLVV